MKDKIARYTVCTITTKDSSLLDIVDRVRKAHGVSHEEIYRKGLIALDIESSTEKSLVNNTEV